MENNIDAPGGQLQQLFQLDRIFMPKARAAREAFYDKQTHARFVHYTSAEAALSIFKTKRIWMRNATCMSDYREVTHGFELLNKFFIDENNKKKFTSALNSCAPNIADESIALFNQWWKDIQFNTYITSISEHNDKEDLHGRLSMWRAFGGKSARVAIVISVPWLNESATQSNEVPPLPIAFNPVEYHKEGELYAEINAVIENVQRNIEFLRSVDRTVLLETIFNMLVAKVTCLKHEGFREEREWRVLYFPKLRPSPLIDSAVETIGGIPQVVYKLALDAPGSNMPDNLGIARIFDRLIIGPSPYPWAQYEAFVDVLKEAGIPNAENRVFTSGIPIRT